MNEELALREDARLYFSQPGFSRFLAELKKRHEASKLGARGYVTLHVLTEQERTTLDGFYGTYTTADQLAVKRYSVAGFSRLLLESKFALTIPQLFLLLEGEVLLTRGERKTVADAEWNGFIDEMIVYGEFSGSAAHEAILSWMECLRSEQTSGSRVLKKLFFISQAAAQECLKHCLNALMILAQTHAQSADQPAALPIRLPILAAHATGDAHALDWKFSSGRLFWWALVEIYGDSTLGYQPNEATDIMEEAEAETEATDYGQIPRAILIREAYRCAGVADDDVSSQVMLFAPGWLQSWEERILTLRQVERISTEDLRNIRPSAVYAVENPSVFAELVDKAAMLRTVTDAGNANNLPILVCVNGQPSVAVIRMLELLCAGDTRYPLYYSGDLDVKGLEITQGLEQRFKPDFHPWRMDKEQYQRYSKRGIPLTESERDRIRLTVYPWDNQLSLEMAKTGIKLYQELWVEELTADWKRFFIW